MVILSLAGNKIYSTAHLYLFIDVGRESCREIILSGFRCSGCVVCYLRIGYSGIIPFEIGRITHPMVKGFFKEKQVALGAFKIDVVEAGRT